MEYVDTKSIVNKTKNSGWYGMDYTMNIYKGCCHGCIYCDSRSRCYQVDKFDTVRAKMNSSEVIESDLKKKMKKGVVGTGAMSDPYNPFEKKHELTRKALKLVEKYRFGIAIDTKSDLIMRDMDIIKEIKTHSPVIIKLTITTYKDELSKIIEPNVSASSERFKAINELAKNDIFNGVLLGPILPFIDDNVDNIKNMVKQASENGANFISLFPGVTLRDNQREWYYNKLDKDFSGLKNKYIETYGEKYLCMSPNYKKLSEVFIEECEKEGLLYKMEDIISAYKTPYDVKQLSLFD